MAAVVVTERVFAAEERTSGVYSTFSPKVSATSALGALEDLRDITGEEPVAVLLFATQGRAPEGVTYPRQPKRVEGTYSLTHRLLAWLHAFTRPTLTEVPMYVRAWFPMDSVIVVPVCTPDWHAGTLVVTKPCAAQAAAIRAFATDLALRLEQADRRARISLLGSLRPPA
jgi:hypothetical protein